MIYGSVAQSVEQRTENPCVGGSIPLRRVNKKTSSLRWGLFIYAIKVPVNGISNNTYFSFPCLSDSIISSITMSLFISIIGQKSFRHLLQIELQSNS